MIPIFVLWNTDIDFKLYIFWKKNQYELNIGYILENSSQISINSILVIFELYFHKYKIESQ